MSEKNSHAQRRWTFFLFVTISLLSTAALNPAQVSQGKDTQVALSQPLVVKWIYSTDSTTNLTPATDGEHVYLPLASGLLISLNALDGRLVWKTDLGGEL